MSVTLFAIQPTGMGWPDYITAISDPSSIAQAVYFDSVDGVAGTNYPTGTINPPVNNEADLRAICAARHIDNVVLKNAASVLKFTSALTGLNFIGEGVSGLTPTIDFNGQAIGCTFNNLRITDTTGLNLVSVSEFLNCDISTVIAHTVGGSNYHECRFAGGITNPPLGIIKCYRDCIFLGDFTNTTGTVTSYGDFAVADLCYQNGVGLINILGDCRVGSLSVDVAGNFTVHGKLFSAGSCVAGGRLDNVDGNVAVYGDCTLAADLDQSGVGNIYIFGNCHIAGFLRNAVAGSVYIHGTCQMWTDLLNAGNVAHGTFKFTQPTPTLNLLSSATSVTERIVNRGSLIVANMVAGATAIIDLSGGTLTIAASCTGGTITLSGDCKLTDLAGGAVTVVDERVPGHA